MHMYMYFRISRAMRFVISVSSRSSICLSRMMGTYADFTEKLAQYDENEMSAADAAYYLEVTTRCTQKMLEILSDS